MNARIRNRLYPQLVERDRERCRICGRPGNRNTLVIDHINNDNGDNRLENLQLLCKSDNSQKNPRGPGRRKLLSPVCVQEIDRASAGSAEMQKNLEAEPAFAHWLYEEIRKSGKITLDDALNGGALAARCSQMTIKRYLKKLTFRDGPFEMLEDQEKNIFIFLRKPAAEKVETTQGMVRRKEDEKILPLRQNTEGPGTSQSNDPENAHKAS
ncbi:MAG: HNH endonuclease signature motif containing protein [Bacteroidota bacterium]